MDIFTDISCLKVRETVAARVCPHTHTHPVYNVLPVTESNFTNISHSLPVQLLRSLLLLRCLQPASLIRPHCVSCRRSAALMYLGDVAAGSKETLQKSIFSSSPEISFNVVSHVFDNKKSNLCHFASHFLDFIIPPYRNPSTGKFRLMVRVLV